MKTFSKHTLLIFLCLFLFLSSCTSLSTNEQDPSEIALAETDFTPIPTVESEPVLTDMVAETSEQTLTPEPAPTPESMPTPEPAVIETPQPIPSEEPTISPTEVVGTLDTAEASNDTPIVSSMGDNTENMTSTEHNGNNESSGGGGDSNFNTYNNTDQQNTEDTYVLNKNSKKIHHPSCSSVPKISPSNYATSSESLESLEAQGYERCKRCFN
ncbi:MAG: hypothetical protein J1E65_03730 [Lachnospiraceae bacterium]|nr:hypothetical protein [Lachnospiraceae bacterium]